MLAAGTQWGFVNCYVQSSFHRATGYCLGHHGGLLVLCPKLLSCACKIPPASESDVSPELPHHKQMWKPHSQTDFWAAILGLQGKVTHRQIFRGDFGDCGRKRPNVPGCEHQEGTWNWPVLTSPSLPLLFFLHCVNASGKCGLGLRTLREKHPLFWLSPPAVVFPSLDRKMLFSVSWDPCSSGYFLTGQCSKDSRQN